MATTASSRRGSREAGRWIAGCATARRVVVLCRVWPPIHCRLFLPSQRTAQPHAVHARLFLLHGAGHARRPSAADLGLRAVASSSNGFGVGGGLTTPTAHFTASSPRGLAVFWPTVKLHRLVFAATALLCRRTSRPVRASYERSANMYGRTGDLSTSSSGGFSVTEIRGLWHWWQASGRDGGASSTAAPAAISIRRNSPTAWPAYGAALDHLRRREWWGSDG